MFAFPFSTIKPATVFEAITCMKRIVTTKQKTRIGDPKKNLLLMLTKQSWIRQGIPQIQ